MATAAALVGLGSGALHSVTGPDHVLSLTPLSVQAGRASWRLGLRWGLGHALGTILVALVAGVLVEVLQLGALMTWGERLGGAALVMTGLMGLTSVRRGLGGRAPAVHGAHAAMGIGFVHGLAGGAAVLAMLPAVAPASGLPAVTYLGGFSVGSTLAMALLTRLLGQGCARLRLDAAWLRRIMLGASGASVVLGVAWMLTGFSVGNH